MGGVVIIAGLTVGTALALLIFWHGFPHARKFADLMVTLGLLGLTVAVAGIGAIDDWGKIKRGRSLGLRAREKLLLQFVVAGLFVAALRFGVGLHPTIGIPGVGEVELGLWYWPVAILFIAGMSNAVNLTDGLDGLATGVTTIAAGALAVLAWGAPGGARLLSGPSVATFLACLAAACLAFLWFNRHPARVFMGDTGSLAIGAALAGAALLIKQELFLLLIGLVYLIEMGSVIIQVISFKTTGKRVFRMSPFHHHLELGGWSEPKIVTRAWGLGLILAGIAIYLFRYLG